MATDIENMLAWLRDLPSGLLDDEFRHHLIQDLEFIARRPPGAGVYATLSRAEGEEPVWKYRSPQYVSLDVDKLDQIRREAQRRREEMIELQKWCGKAGDRDGARFFREEAADAMKEYRAACLHLSKWACDPPGDCREPEEWNWPAELAPWLSRVVGLAQATR